MLFEMYVQDMDAPQYIIYAPSVQRSLERLYHEAEYPLLSDCALLLSKFARLTKHNPDLLDSAFGGGPLAHYWLG